MSWGEIIAGAVEGITNSVFGFVNAADDNRTIRSVEASRNRADMLGKSTIVSGVIIAVLLLVIMVVMIKS